ncbi:caspase activity and apoptosis inhibitor 1 isoform X2 [Latimeria chalumnae]|uniref:caspase activity and apoptosis inhibitor 1 isoform X2 n=1 Tax=Latimeria chalumnae TaxID=7897 RepID=UPI00313D3F6F
MTNKKSGKEKKRKHSHSEGHCERKRSTESGAEDVKHSSLPSAEKAEAEEPSDLEEGGLDLNVTLKPIHSYISDKKEMLEQCFRVIGEKKLQKMLPDVLKSCSSEEIRRLCLEQLEGLSEKKLLQILEDVLDSSNSEEEADNVKIRKKGESDRQQDNSIDSTSSIKDSTEVEALEQKQGSGVSGDESDALSINADAYDSDIEGPCGEAVESKSPDVAESTTGNDGEVRDDLQKDIEKSVSEILALAEPTPREPSAVAVAASPAEGTQPSAQQLELLELEMRARAIKALMKAGDTKK